MKKTMNNYSSFFILHYALCINKGRCLFGAAFFCALWFWILLGVLIVLID